jgi:hypothetical protein
MKKLVKNILEFTENVDEKLEKISALFGLFV